MGCLGSLDSTIYMVHFWHREQVSFIGHVYETRHVGGESDFAPGYGEARMLHDSLSAGWSILWSVYLDLVGRPAFLRVTVANLRVVAEGDFGVRSLLGRSYD